MMITSGKAGKKMMYGKYDEYEIEDCVNTLIRAKKIMMDKEKMKHVKIAAMNRIHSAKMVVADMNMEHPDMMMGEGKGKEKSMKMGDYNYGY